MTFKNRPTKRGRLLSAWLLLGIATAVLPASGQDVARMPEADPLVRQCDAWARLDLSGGRRITAVRLILLNDGPFGEERPATFDERIKDAETLKLLEAGFSNATISMPQREGSWSGVRRLGRMICTTTDGEADITVLSHAFQVAGSPDKPETAQLFHSPRLAYVLAAILKSKKLAPFKEQEFEWLTGERRIRAEIADIRKRIAKTPALVEPEDTPK